MSRIASLGMEITEDFRINSKAETKNYLESRGFSLFDTLGHRLHDLLLGKSNLSEAIPTEVGKDRLIGDTLHLGANWRKTQVDENWGLHVKEVRNEDFVEYELFSVIDTPSEE